MISYRHIFAVMFALLVGQAGVTYRQTQVGGAPPDPAVQPAPLDGYDDDRAYVKAMADQAAELTRQAELNLNATTRIDLLLRAANVILANELEPACTSKLLRLDEENAPAITAEVRAALDRADSLLTKAREAMGTEAEASPAPPGEASCSQES